MLAAVKLFRLRFSLLLAACGIPPLLLATTFRWWVESTAPSFSRPSAGLLRLQPLRETQMAEAGTSRLKPADEELRCCSPPAEGGGKQQPDSLVGVLIARALSRL